MRRTDPVSGRGAIGYHVGGRRRADRARGALAPRDGVAVDVANEIRACARTHACAVSCCAVVRGGARACGGGAAARATSDVLRRTVSVCSAAAAAVAAFVAVCSAAAVAAIITVVITALVTFVTAIITLVITLVLALQPPTILNT